MAQPYVYLRYRSSSHSQLAAFKSIDRQVSQIGSDFGSDAGLSVSPIIVEYSRIIHWENDLYAMDEENIWKYDVEASGSWGVLHTFATPNTTNSAARTRRLGLTPCSIDGAPLLVCGYGSSGGNETCKIVRITSSGVFEDAETDLTAGESHNVSLLEPVFNTPVAYRNNIVWTGRNDTYLYDLKGSSITITGAHPAGAAGQHPSLCVFRDKLFVLYASTVSCFVARLDGTTWTTVATLHSKGGSNNTVEKGVIFPFEDKLCTFSFGSNPDEMFAHSLEFAAGSTSSPTVVDNSVAVFAGDFGGNTDTNTTRVGPVGTKRAPQWFARQDLLTNGPSSPIYQLGFVVGSTQTEGASSIELYSWVPPDNALVFIDAGLDPIRYGRINNVDSTAGEYIWAGSGVLNASSPTLSVDGTNVDATYEIFGPSSTSGLINLRLLYDAEGEYVFTQGTIDTTDVGVLVGNDVTALSPGDIVTVSWAAAVDGIKLGDNPKVASYVFT
jgi:hypothetical protein